MKKTTLVSAAAALTVLVSASINQVSAAPSPSTYKIVGLGDSITAGFEPAMIANPTITPYGYADRLLEQGLFNGRTELANYGILGLTSNGLAHYVDAVKDGRAIAPDDIEAGLKDPRIKAMGAATAKTQADLKAANVIVMTIGGNDLSPLLATYQSLSDTDLLGKTQDMITTYSKNLTQVLTDLKSINPKASIVIADQYEPIPQLAVGAADYAKLTKVAAAFTQSVDDIAANVPGVKVAHVAAAFAGKELALTHIVEKDIHPTQAGYEVIAKVFTETLGLTYRTTDAANDKAPLSIVAKGKELKTAPIVKNNQTFVALGELATALGAKTAWDGKKQVATVSLGGQNIAIPVGTKANQALMVNGKTYVPLTMLSAGLGLGVQSRNNIKTVFINL